MYVVRIFLPRTVMLKGIKSHSTVDFVEKMVYNVTL